MDMKTIFLNDEQKKIKFVQNNSEASLFHVSGQNTKVCKFINLLYKIKQVP